MKNKTIKKFLTAGGSASTLQAAYNKEASSFQRSYNSRHPRGHIWKHAYYNRDIRTLLNGDEVTAVIRIVRFIISGTSETFTFYGSSILPRTSYSFSILSAWIHKVPAILSPSVVLRWTGTVEQGRNPSRVSRPGIF